MAAMKTPAPHYIVLVMSPQAKRWWTYAFLRTLPTQAFDLSVTIDLVVLEDSKLVPTSD
jgi:hypothetical protein